VAFFALADLHLGFAVDKPMDMFGERWRNHSEKINENWRKTVTDDDIVLVPGDISWALKLDEVRQDFDFLAQLPGRKVLIRGNHDYWWDSISKVREILPPGMFALQNDHLVFDGVAVCGARGWNLPVQNDQDYERDKRIFLRERNRLALSLQSAPADLPKIAMLHYPPCYHHQEEVGFCDILEKFKVELCVFGHLHGEDHRLALRGRHNNVNYVFCAADAVDFTPVRIDTA